MAAYGVPPSPDYIPGPEVPPSPDYIPGPEGPPSPDYVPGPEEPEQAPPSPVYLPYRSLGYIPESEPEEDPKEDPADYPADRDDDDEEEEEEEEDTQHRRLCPTEHTDDLTARISIREATISLPPLGKSPTHIEILESCLPLRKRVRFASPTPSQRGSGDSYSGRELDYGITDTWDDLVGAIDEIAPTTVEGVNQRVTDLATIVEEETTSMYGIMEDAQDDRDSLLKPHQLVVYSGYWPVPYVYRLASEWMGESGGWRINEGERDEWACGIRRVKRGVASIGSNNRWTVRLGSTGDKAGGDMRSAL
ncbi:hypothetical protein Tco_0457783 [Tanacetum coccineum]